MLAWEDEICDARYSKSCGGMTEAYRAAWEEKDVPYLTPVYDGPSRPMVFLAVVGSRQCRSLDHIVAPGLLRQ